jgi:hypothetical protein
LIKEEEIYTLLDGCALLKCLGNLYEYAKITKSGKYLFRGINNNRWLLTSHKNLKEMPEYEIKS